GGAAVAANATAQGAPPTAPGTPPDLWIEVDTTKPNAQLTGVPPSVDDPYSVVITWAASDKNLASEPVDLYYAVQPQGPWLPVARNLKNDGSYVWRAPRDAGPQFFVRLDVTDKAGNTTPRAA